MKNLIFILTLFALISCGGKSNNNKTESESTDTETIEQKDKSLLAKNDCNQFLDDYEKWVNDFLELYKKFKDDPMNAEYTQKMMESSQKMAEWSQKWIKLYDCSKDKKYAKRMEELQKKVEKDMEELAE